LIRDRCRGFIFKQVLKEFLNSTKCLDNVTHDTKDTNKNVDVTRTNTSCWQTI